jgi:DHA2 family multidrug resistance protein
MSSVAALRGGAGPDEGVEPIASPAAASPAPLSNTGPAVANRGAITACVILAVVMQALDTTIANVALPYIQGSVSASADQINWVLTSYITAAAIMTPAAGYFANRFGRKRVLLISVAGFVVASILCGIAQSLLEIVGFRLLQGMFGAALVPLAQSILLDIYTPAERGSAMAVFGVSIMVGPVLGPVIGGWLTDNISWRWVFYINLGIGAVAFAGISAFVTETKRDALARLDWMGFGTLSLTIASLQIFLDRGEQLDWFSSGEIQIEALVCACAFYVFLVHTFTARKPFVDPRLFRDRNFAVGIVFIFVVGITYLASMALMTPYLQTLMDYPIVTAGLVMGPRGIGTMASMFLVGKLIGRVEVRWLLLAGLVLTAWAMNDMTGWTRDVSEMRIVETGFVQGAGLGFLFVPLSVVTFSTLSSAQRQDGTGLYNLSRNIGSSVGISVVTALLAENVQANHADIAGYVTPFNAMFHLPAVARMLSPYTAQGRAALDGVVTTQATMIAYMDDFRLLMLMAVAAMPLVFLLKKAAGPVAVDHSAVME